MKTKEEKKQKIFPFVMQDKIMCVSNTLNQLYDREREIGERERINRSITQNIVKKCVKSR